jgi:hypothetical protein
MDKIVKNFEFLHTFGKKTACQEFPLQFTWTVFLQETIIINERQTIFYIIFAGAYSWNFIHMLPLYPGAVD